MSIQMNENTFGYMLIALGVLMGVGMIFGIFYSKKTGSSSIIRLKHLLAPPIIIAVGVGFAFGMNNRSSAPCEAGSDQENCFPSVKQVKPFKVNRPE